MERAMEMNWSLIIVSILAILLALKFVKTLGKVIVFIILVVAVCIFLVGVYGINQLELFNI